jgi:hypothetical protein
MISEIPPCYYYWLHSSSAWIQWSHLTLRWSNFITSVWYKGPKDITIEGKEDGPGFLRCPLPLTPHIVGGVHIRRLWWPVKSSTSASSDSHAWPTDTRCFLHIFQIVRPSVKSLGSLRPASTYEFDMPGLRHIRTRTLSTRMTVHKKLYKNCRNISVTCIYNLATAARVTSETHD